MEIWKGRGRRIEDIDLPRIGALIGVGEDEVHAILDVESAGSGFDGKGRVKMLFEPHVFWRLLGPGPKRNAAAAAGLAYARWKPGAYPRDSFPRLIEARMIDPELALQSASWGIGQIMGFNFKAAGYASADAMVSAFADGEDKHLEAMILFIKSKGLDAALRRHDWAGFARGYNGAGFAKNGYDRKLKEAFDRWQRIKDTPWSPAVSVPVPAGPVRTPEAMPVNPVAEPDGQGIVALVAVGAALVTAGLASAWAWIGGLFGW